MRGLYFRETSFKLKPREMAKILFIDVGKSDHSREF